MVTEASLRIVKNSLFGSTPSMADTPSKIILRGFVKLNFCLKIEMLSIRMDHRFTVNLVGEPERAFNLSHVSLREHFSLFSFEHASSIKNILLHESTVCDDGVLLVFIRGNSFEKENVSFWWGRG